MTEQTTFLLGDEAAPTELLLSNFSDIIISISGGKDSQMILGVMMDRIKAQGYAGSVRAIHADTGAEWPQSLPHCEMLCDHYGIPLDVAIPFRALPEHMERRCGIVKQWNIDHEAKILAGDEKKRAGWASSACRYCTSDCKRAPIDKVVRGAFPARSTGSSILSVTGERRQESAHREKLPELEPHKRLTAGSRVVTMYRPILDYTLDQVWAHIASTGLPRHVAYDKGNKRLSCAICVLASDDDIRNGAAECPDLAEHYLRIEREYGFTMKNGKSLAQILALGAD